MLDHRNKTDVLVRMENLLSYKSYKQKELIIQTNLTVEELDIIATSKFCWQVSPVSFRVF